LVIESNFAEKGHAPTVGSRKSTISECTSSASLGAS
jgi:hypothetical protein